MLFESQRGITCPREYCYTCPNTTFTSLRIPAWRGGVATVLCQGQARCFTATPARYECQPHINVLELEVIHLTPLYLKEEVLSQTSPTTRPQCRTYTKYHSPTHLLEGSSRLGMAAHYTGSSRLDAPEKKMMLDTRLVPRSQLLKSKDLLFAHYRVYG